MRTLEEIKTEVIRALRGHESEYQKSKNGVALFKLDMDEQIEKMEQLKYKVEQLESDIIDRDLDINTLEEELAELERVEDGKK